MRQNKGTFEYYMHRASQHERGASQKLLIRPLCVELRNAQKRNLRTSLSLIMKVIY